MKTAHIFSAGPPTTVYALVNTNGVISLFVRENDTLDFSPTAQSTMVASAMKSESVNGYGAEEVPVNFQVALRIVATPLQLFLPFIDPTLLNLDGEDCDSAETFTQWFNAAVQSGSPRPTAQIVVAADGDSITNGAFVGRTVTGIIINDVTKNTGYDVAGDTLTFTDGTTVAEGQTVTVIF